MVAEVRWVAEVVAVVLVAAALHLRHQRAHAVVLHREVAAVLLARRAPLRPLETRPWLVGAARRRAHVGVRLVGRDVDVAEGAEEGDRGRLEEGDVEERGVPAVERGGGGAEG